MEHVLHPAYGGVGYTYSFKDLDKTTSLGEGKLYIQKLILCCIPLVAEGLGKYIQS